MFKLSFHNMIVHFRVPYGQVHVDDREWGGLKPYAFQKTAYIGLVYGVKRQEKTTDLSHVTDKLDQILLYRVHLSMNGVRTHIVSGHRH